MKTTFSRQFVMITALLLVCISIIGVSLRFLMVDTLEKEKQESLCRDAEVVSNLLQAYELSGTAAANWDFLIMLSMFSEVGDSEALICSPDGTVLLCSCEEFGCSHVGMQLDAAFLDEMRAAESVYQRAGLSEIFSERRFVCGRQVPSLSGGAALGFVVVSAPMTQIDRFIASNTALFLYTSVVVVFLGVLAASVLSRTQVRPLAQMAETVRRYGRGELSARAEISRKNTQEVNELARAFNNMAQSLEQSERRRQEFVANVSHELKTPMTTIGGYIDGMLDGTIEPDKQQHYMQIVSGEVRRLSRLVRNMLDISRIQAQGIDESRRTRFDLTEAMGDVLITFEQKINAKGLQVQVDFPEKAVWVRAERDFITQVGYNLLDNAIKFCPNGGELGLSIRPGGALAQVSVQNTGPTIDPAELPLLFDRFHKADKSRSADREGWGLGLYIAKTIVGASGGDIWAESENGRTTFFFTLPTVR